MVCVWLFLGLEQTLKPTRPHSVSACLPMQPTPWVRVRLRVRALMWGYSDVGLTAVLTAPRLLPPCGRRAETAPPQAAVGFEPLVQDGRPFLT